MTEVARGCPGSGWVLTLTAGHAHLMASFPEQGQRDFNNNFFTGIGGRDQAEGVYTPVERGGLGSNTPGIAGKLYADASRLLGHHATNLNTAGWDTTMLIRHAYETSDDPRKGIRDAIESTKDVSVIGGFISYTPTDHGGKDARDVVVARWHDGHFVDAN
jgi:ABC-type branched-subunit amino acid transport system substrate-binding protein